VQHTTCADRAEALRLAFALFDKAVQAKSEGLDTFLVAEEMVEESHLPTEIGCDPLPGLEILE
jgi:hypothetical protein